MNRFSQKVIIVNRNLDGFKFDELWMICQTFSLPNFPTIQYNDTCVHVFHVYQDIWRPVIEELRCQREEDNPRDPYAVAVLKPRTGVVGHVLHYLSTLCSLFIR